MNRLLIVEDEKLIRAGIHTMIQRSGVPVTEILEANNGEKALEILKSEHVDAVFTDIRMPRMDGIELVREIQNLPYKPYIVAISGYDDFSYAVEMLRNGVMEYLLKPIEREKLREVLIKINDRLSENTETEKAELMKNIQLIGTNRQKELIDAWEDFFRGAEMTDGFCSRMHQTLRMISDIYKEIMTPDMKATMKQLDDPMSFTDMTLYKESFMNFILLLNGKREDQGDTSPQERKMQEAVTYIRKNFRNDLNMAVVSNYLSMNYTLFSSAFKQYTGETFVTYLKNVRMTEACRLLTDTDDKIIEVASESGYDDYKNFLKHFRMEFGVSPKEYRKNMSKRRQSNE